MLAASAGLALLLAAAPARVQVAADEFTYALSRTSIRAGPVLIELANFGEDAHDLRLRRIGPARTRAWSLPRVPPGRQDVLAATLRPGTYRLWCSIADHRARGMRATLVALPPRRPLSHER